MRTDMSRLVNLVITVVSYTLKDVRDEEEISRLEAIFI
jgi:hypothetical protein